MRTKHLYVIVFFTLLFSPVWSQISGVVNLYVPITNIQPDCGHITVSSSSGYSIGDRVLLIQMKGATMSTTMNSTYGDLTALNDAGAYEFNYIDNIVGNDIYLKYTLTHTYNYTNAGLQLIRVPVYSDVTINGMVTALPWDGTIGGVVAIEVTGTLTFADGINVTGLGFKGGLPNPSNTYNACSASEWGFSKATTPLADHGGLKGEGIAVTAVGLEAGHGKQVNGGGGGMSNNTGGGGGSNAGAGGLGGIQSTTGCFTASSQGKPGIALTYSNPAGRVFLGGGGGGGHQNNLLGGGPATNQAGATAGGYGGGIVIIRANIIEGNGQLIQASGTSPLYRAIGDSGGGGGGGGAVLVSYNTLNSGFNVNVMGAKGGDVDSEAPSPYTRKLGPGGGGGGGAFWTNKATVDPMINVQNAGGTKGICGYTSYPSGVSTYTIFPAAQQSAIDGNAGLNVTSLVLNDAVSSCNPLPVSLLYFRGQQGYSDIAFTWATAQELNNREFVLQRSFNGKDYETVYTVAGVVSSQRVLQYQYTDHVRYQGVVYYRLLQVDIDGTTTISGTLYFNVTRQSFVGKVYPNPADQGLFYVELKEDITPIDLSLVDVTGRKVNVQFHQNANMITVDAGSVATGVYNLYIQTQESIEVYPIMIR